MKRLLVATLFTFVLFLLIPAVNPQTFRGSINGTVTDPSGAVVAGATVKATESATSIDHTTGTRSEGQFAFQDLPLGVYKVSVTDSGFPTYAVDKVEALAGQIYTLAVQLKMSQSATTIEVNA